MSRPNFFLVGAPKSGTTTLFLTLGRHPQVFVAEQKEPTFFGSDLRADHFVRERSLYLDLFARATNEKARGEASAWYLYSRMAAAEIRRFDPKARIVVTLRDPVQVMFSLHAQQIFNSNEKLTSFEAALDAEHQRRCEQATDTDDFFRNGLLYRDVVQFDTQIQRYFEEFSRDQVHIIIFDDFVRTPIRELRRLESFLDIEVLADAEPPVANAAKKVRSHTAQRFLNHPPPQFRAWFRKWFPVELRSRLIPTVRRLNYAYGRGQINPGTERQLREEMTPMVGRLEELIDRDLRAWKTPARAGRQHSPSSSLPTEPEVESAPAHFPSYRPVQYWNHRARSSAGSVFRACGDISRSPQENLAMHRIQLAVLRRLLNRVGRIGRVVEVGCGVGRLAPFFTSRGSSYVGLDIALEMLTLARDRYPGIPLLQVAEGGLSLDSRSTDLTVSVTVLHHAQRTTQDKLVTEMVRVTRVGGYLLLLEGLKVPGEPTREQFNYFPRSIDGWINGMPANLELVESFPARWWTSRDALRFLVRSVKSRFADRLPTMVGVPNRFGLERFPPSLYGPLSLLDRGLLSCLPLHLATNIGLLFRRCE